MNPTWACISSHVRTDVSLVLSTFHSPQDFMASGTLARDWCDGRGERNFEPSAEVRKLLNLVDRLSEDGRPRNSEEPSTSMPKAEEKATCTMTVRDELSSCWNMVLSVVVRQLPLMFPAVPTPELHLPLDSILSA